MTGSRRQRGRERTPSGSPQSLGERPLEERSVGQPTTTVAPECTLTTQHGPPGATLAGGVAESEMHETACIGGEDTARGGPPVGCGGVRRASLLRGRSRRGAARAVSGPYVTFLDLTVSTLLERPRKGQTRRPASARMSGDERGGRVLERHGVGARSRSRHDATGTPRGASGREFPGREAQESHGRVSSATKADATDARREESLEVERGPGVPGRTS